jgi:YhcH/YjgK/YiaL family protein
MRIIKKIEKKFNCRIFLVALITILFTSCHTAKQSGSIEGDSKNVSSWFNSQKWLNGLNIQPHESINKEEFYRQYNKNNKYWDEAFNFLKTHDLTTLPKGNYIIDTGNVIASVSEVSPKQKDEVNWEAHRNFNDLQYIIAGKTGMGVSSISNKNAVVTIPYTLRGDTETFTVSDGAYFDADQSKFFIFSPQDIHRPAFKAQGYDQIKKIVIKVRVP